jgi:DNA-binding transcriptional regulator YiaG
MSLAQDVTNASDLIELFEARRLASTGEAHKIRAACGLSLADIAAAIGRTPATVSRWEHAQTVPYGAAARRYGRLLAELREHLNGTHQATGPHTDVDPAGNRVEVKAPPVVATGHES